MLEALLGFPKVLKQKYAEASKAPEAKPPTEAKPPEAEMDGPKAVLPPISSEDKARWVAISATGKVLSDDMESLVNQYSRLCELNLMQKKSGEEFRLNPAQAWDFMESASRLFEKLENFRLDIVEFRKKEIVKTEAFCNDASRLIAQKDKELSEGRLGHHEQISDLKMGFEAALSSLKDKVAQLEENPNRQLDEAKIKFSGEMLVLKEAHAQEIAKFQSDYVSEVQKLQGGHEQTLVNLESVWQNKLAVAKDEAKKWRNRYLKKGKR